MEKRLEQIKLKNYDGIHSGLSRILNVDKDEYRYNFRLDDQEFHFEFEELLNLLAKKAKKYSVDFYVDGFRFDHEVGFFEFHEFDADLDADSEAQVIEFAESVITELAKL
ncbi:MAG: hypothetical protein JXQ65_09545 [Candidatus Marinimicrobia bacterium]|nr:hypothetical protein [Candidatus Neomarinimicrobiota bacterium]